MSETKHLFYESGTVQRFYIVYNEEEHLIEMPDKFDDVDATIDINEDFFNIDNFIIGETTKVTFLEYSNPVAFNLIKSAYDTEGSEAKIGFRWRVINDGVTTEVLDDDFELNLNKYTLSHEMSMLKIETEIKKRELHTKLLTREDVSVNLFDEETIDGEAIGPLPTIDVYYKEGARSKGNFYFYDTAQKSFTGAWDYYMFRFATSEDNDLGSVQYKGAGFWEDSGSRRGGEPFLFTRIFLPALTLEVSNMNVYGRRDDNSATTFKLVARKVKGGTVVETIDLATSVATTYESFVAGQIKIVNQSFPIGSLKVDEELYLYLEAVGANVRYLSDDTSWSVEVKANLSTPLRKTKMVRLEDALIRICKLTSSSTLSVTSSVLSSGGAYYNTGVSTGIFLRGVANIFLGEEKLTTSLKTLFYDSVAPLMALGFDLREYTLKVEGLDYFFAPIEAYDLSDKEYIQTEYSSSHDLEFTFNQLHFGSKKFSTNNKGDLLNYNTELEAVTPLKSVKTKFDKTVDAILDEDKIQELILDKSSSTNNGDDELVLVDLVSASTYVDSGILTDCVHGINEDGDLELISYDTPFDTLPIAVGQMFTITSGINSGTYEVLAIDKARITLDLSVGIVTGETDTPISYVVQDVLKNRTSEGFSYVGGVRDNTTCSNLRHNPKYQMARWFPYFSAGISKMPNSAEIKVSDYKNNGNVVLEPSDLPNELQGMTELDANETLGRLRSYKDPIFTGETEEVALHGVTFHEFMECYTFWRYGLNGRGYLKVNTPLGLRKIYPFGNGAFKFEGRYNTLIISGKVRRESTVAGGEILLSAPTVVNSDTLSFAWTYSGFTPSGSVIEVRKGSEGVWTWRMRTLTI